MVNLPADTETQLSEEKAGSSELLYPVRDSPPEGEGLAGTSGQRQFSTRGEIQKHQQVFKQR